MSTFTTPIDDFDSILTDGFLGPEVAIDHDRPPVGSFVFGPAYDGTCFICKDNLLYHCKPKQPEYWPALFFIEVGIKQFPLKTGLFYNQHPYVFNTREIYYVAGTGSGSFLPTPMKAKAGAQSAMGAVSVDGKGIYHTGPDGIYLFANGIDTKITEVTLEPIFRGETIHGLPGVSDMSTSWMCAFKNNLYFGYQSAGDSYPANVLVLNLETDKLAYFIYNDGSDVEIRTIAVDETNKRLLVGDSTGFVRVIEDTAETTDSDVAISWEVESKDFTLQTRKHFPRFVKYDVDASLTDSCTGALILDRAVHQTHTITGDRVTKRRLVGTGNGDKSAIRISGTGPATIYAAESE
jgi:hypothetical protein